VFVKLALTRDDLFSHPESAPFPFVKKDVTHRIYKTPNVCVLTSKTCNGSCPFDRKLHNTASFDSRCNPLFKVWFRVTTLFDEVI